MDLRIFTEPQQGATYDQLLAVAKATERLGFDAFFRSDHYLKMGDVSGLPGPTDAWITLAGLARETEPDPARHAGHAGDLPPARAAGDQRRPGRRHERRPGRARPRHRAGTTHEHTAYGIPFPPLGERFEMLEEQLAIVTGLWATPVGEPFVHDGKHYTAGRLTRRCPSRCSAGRRS